ncbi:uncharacterized protein LOC121918023 [Sceloporus undulatus]|uniref:uncharacterized protein LOC121918023 n=1 Tax=Sceloporus undulatus TaxID=8520 RepID=UPI001C4DAD34|nr:uncharacterized protein LOC121918023 [Sceloporus undulatus]
MAAEGVRRFMYWRSKEVEMMLSILKDNPGVVPQLMQSTPRKNIHIFRRVAAGLRTRGGYVRDVHMARRKFKYLKGAFYALIDRFGPHPPQTEKQKFPQFTLMSELWDIAGRPHPRERFPAGRNASPPPPRIAQERNAESDLEAERDPTPPPPQVEQHGNLDQLEEHQPSPVPSSLPDLENDNDLDRRISVLENRMGVPGVSQMSLEHRVQVLERRLQDMEDKMGRMPAPDSLQKLMEEMEQMKTWFAAHTLANLAS